MKGDREKCLDAGMNDYLAKPIANDSLLEKLHVWLLGHEPDNEEGKDPRSDDDPWIKGVTVWNEKEALAMVKQRVDRLKILLESFCQNVPGNLDKLRVAMEQQDYDKVRYYAHTIKGSAGQIKAGQLEQVTANIEIAVQEQAFSKVQSLQHQLFHESQVVLDRFKEWLQAHP